LVDLDTYFGTVVIRFALDSPYEAPHGRSPAVRVGIGLWPVLVRVRPAEDHRSESRAMFDGHEMHTPGLVVVSGASIIGIGAGAALPAGAQVIDFGDATLSPGFIDAHTHLSMMYNADYNKKLLDSLEQSIPEQTLLATVNLKKTLMAGVTTVRDVGSSDFMDVGLRNAVTAGAIPGPRMLVAVNAIGSTGGHCDWENGFRSGLFGRESGPEEGVINNPDEGRRAVRLNIKYGADVIKICPRAACFP
jgi:imidazolonepropionase-like amidohydrolase